MKRPILLLATLLLACRREPTAAMDAAVARGFAGTAGAEAPVEQPLAAHRASAPPGAPVVDRRIIRTAEIRIELTDVVGGVRSADSIAAALGGIVANTQTLRGTQGEAESQLTLRVPTARFAEAMTALRVLGQVRVENTNADDVTRTYNDIEIRLAVKRDLVARLRALLSTRTARLADVLNVERELARAVTELEQMEGERRYLDNQVSMSTIRASFFHQPVAGPGSLLDAIRVAVRQSVAVLGQSVAAVVGGLVFALPWVVVFAIGWRVYRAVRRRRLAGANT